MPRPLTLPPQCSSSLGGLPWDPQTQHPSGSTSLPGPRASGRTGRPQITFPVLAHTGVLQAALWRRAGEMTDSVLSPTFSALYRQQGTVSVMPRLPAEWLRAPLVEQGSHAAQQVRQALQASMLRAPLTQTHLLQEALPDCHTLQNAPFAEREQSVQNFGFSKSFSAPRFF